jgi:hypothetical protein
MLITVNRVKQNRLSKVWEQRGVSAAFDPIGAATSRANSITLGRALLLSVWTGSKSAII